MNKEIEIDYRPIKKVVLLDILELNSNQLFERVSAMRIAGEPLFLNWAEGIVFIAVPASTEIAEVDENITKGIVYFAGVSFAHMPIYQPWVQVGPDKIPIVDQSNSPLFISLANWLKERTKKE